MDRSFYLDLARAGARFPIGAHLVLCEKPDHEALHFDGPGLGRVIVETARRFRTPLALPLMDLTVEKTDIAAMLGIPEAQAGTFHFGSDTPADILDRVRAQLDRPLTSRMRANTEAIRHVAATPELVPVGMAIGPFSLMTKLLDDPITPVFMAGAGTTGDDDPEIRLVEGALEVATLAIIRGIRAQIEAGARAVCLCEPAANKIYISPKQLDAGSDIFERYVMTNLRRISKTLADLGADLILHDCGELTEPMVRDFATLNPAILSLGSSRCLWEDARFVPKTTVLYGNLPTKNFYSDAQVPDAMVEQITRDLVRHMREIGHPFIVGSECDVLSVPGSETTIKAKIERMMNCAP